MQFREEAIRDNVHIALMYVVYDLSEGNWFDAAWVAARMNELGHDVAESSMEYSLRELAEQGDLDRDGGYYKPSER